VDKTVSERSRRSRRRRQQTKDRVLQARIPQQLDEELKDRAEQLGLSVSTVVRNVLLHTFDLVEGVVADSAQLARVIQGRESPSPAATPAPGERPESGNEAAVIGWQEAVLNRNGICEQCNAILPMGQRAAVGVPVQARPVLLCLDCLAGLTPAPDQAEANKKSPAKKTGRNIKTSN
jgi:hypothetical protein